MSTKVNFAEGRKKAETEGLLSGSKRLKVEEGENRIRLLSECLAHPGEFNGTPTFKWLCYVIDRKDGKIKPYFMPNTVYKEIEKLQRNPEYAFEEVPMPYDVTIVAVNAGKLEVEYSLVPARTNTPLTPAEQALWRGTQPIRELQEALHAEAGGKVAVQENVSDEAGPRVGVDMPG